jgi:hypothetical protein
MFPLIQTGKLNLKLKMWQYLHCFQTTPLIDKSYFVKVWNSFFDYISKRFNRQIIFEADSFFLPKDMLESLTEILKVRNQKNNFKLEIKRPIINFSSLDLTNISMGKHLEKKARQLCKKGPLKISFSSKSSALSEFLNLEHRGYKGQVLKTSLLSSRSETNFIKELFTSKYLSPGIIKLTLGNDLISAIIFIRSNSIGYCFKICFNESYSKYSPGAIIVEKIHEINQQISVSQIDSCVAKNSQFKSKNWTEYNDVMSIRISNNSSIGNIFINK